MTEPGPDWRMVDGVATAWFDAPSLVEGAALAGRLVELPALVDVRATGVRVRLDPGGRENEGGGAGETSAVVSGVARELGLTPDPSVLQQLSVVFESARRDAVRRFWQPVLGYSAGEDGGLADPLRRDPDIRVRSSDELRPLRNRIHLDVVRPAAAVERVRPGEASGPYGVWHSDPDGNEIDLVPGEALGEKAADWQAVFSAMACYRVSSPVRQRDLVIAAAGLAHDAGFPLLIDLRPGLVILDSGKDQWEDDAHGLGLDFTDLAADLQTAARELGATADPGLPRFAQVFLDAADVAAVRAFWIAALGYQPDRREGLSDIHDPRRLNPELVFQELDAADTERRRQRNRIHVELAVPADLAPARLAAALAAGGRLLEEPGERRLLEEPAERRPPEEQAERRPPEEQGERPEGRLRVRDPEGNELVIVSEG